MSSLPALEDVRVRPGDGVECRRTVRADEDYLPGHYPGFPIMPGVLVIETARQAVARYATETRGEPVDATLDSVDTVRFLRPVRPGHTMRLDARCAEEGDTIVATVRCSVGDDDVARMRIKVRIREAANDG